MADQRIQVALTDAPLSLDDAADSVRRDDCGAVVVFGGTVRDHAEGRPGVVELEYEAYTEAVKPRLQQIAEEAIRTWPGLGNVALLHRTGTLKVGEYSVIVAVSAGHRGEAFEAGRYCIDTLKRSVPIWKRERWSGGEDWGLDAHDVADVAQPEGVPR